ncbi:MAG: thioesterase family protein [Erythrobacter sp.]|uniref:acyl-CoA thioesterase domain-containing protein n=1 Tax=Erythrobacter sp. TaxID=1042 RepID=UPI002608A2AA|nr:acyl-CoA thioesterase domain-containing protein [Erythrobacter sp.]MDJ0979697.1 thioesterase family protein [Erythrobacter sp.]
MSFIDLEPQGTARFRLVADERHCVGPIGHCFLFGGAAAAAAAKAMEKSCSAYITILDTHFYRSISYGSELLIEVEFPKKGRQLQRARAVGTVDGRVVMESLGALSEDVPEATRRWRKPASNPASPEDCPQWDGFPPQDQRGRLLKRLDIRYAQGAPCDDTGVTTLWARTRDGGALDTVQLCLFADLLPGGIGHCVGRVGGGASLDNHLRVVAAVDTEWVLCEMQTLAANSRLAHGEMRLFSAEGALLATASQSVQIL